MGQSGGDLLPILGLLAQRLVRPLAFAGPALAQLVPQRPGSRRLALAPRDLHTSDPTLAIDIYSGLFAFAGKTVETRGASPFAMTPPSDEWARELHGFSWLRHLRASENELTRSNGRALVEEWLRTRRTHPAIADEPLVVAQRLTSWLAHSALLLNGCDRAFERRFMRALDRHVAALSLGLARVPDGLPRFLVTAALAGAGAALEDQPRLLRRASRRLEREVGRQILPDGGHVSRNPLALVACLAELLPVRQALSLRGEPAAQRLGEVVHRMMPMLAFFRHPDGKFAHFNGAGTAPRGLSAAILAYDDTHGQPAAYARYSGYQRIDAEDAVLLMDVGAAPPLAFAGAAHAGCLSFEFSAGAQQIIVNCGALREARPDWRLAGRTTAAHSTVAIEEASSARILAGAPLVRALGPLLYRGPETVTVDRSEDHAGTVLSASHDGYQGDFGVIHRRVVALGRDGRRLRGRDRLEAEVAVAFAARFHLHPDIDVTASATGDAAVLASADGARWRFAVDSGQRLTIEDSVHLSEHRRLRRTRQIVVRDNTANAASISWSLEQQAAVPAATEDPTTTTAAGAANGDTPGEDASSGVKALRRLTTRARRPKDRA